MQWMCYPDPRGAARGAIDRKPANPDPDSRMALTPDQTALLRKHVPSVWTLELLLLLRNQPDRLWTGPQLVQELRASSRLVSDNLARLERAGLAAPHGSQWRWAPASPVLSDFCDALEAAYRERPVAIINLIVSPQDPIQGLADAFKFKGGSR